MENAQPNLKLRATVAKWLEYHYDIPAKELVIGWRSAGLTWAQISELVNRKSSYKPTTQTLIDWFVHPPSPEIERGMRCIHTGPAPFDTLAERKVLTIAHDDDFDHWLVAADTYPYYAPADQLTPLG